MISEIRKSFGKRMKAGTRYLCKSWQVGKRELSQQCRAVLVKTPSSPCSKNNIFSCYLLVGRSNSAKKLVVSPARMAFLNGVWTNSSF